MALGSKRERRPGVWELRYRGQSLTVHVDGARAANRELAKFVLDVQDGRHQKAAAKTVAQLLEWWLRDHRNEWQPRTYSENAAFVRRYLAPARSANGLGDLNPGKVTARDLRRLYTHLASKVGPPTARRAHVHLNAAFSAAVRSDELAVNPCARVRPPKVPRQPEREVALADVLAVLAECERRWHAEDNPRLVGTWHAMCAVIVTAIVTGARRGEIAALRWSDIDLGAGTVRISRAITIGLDGNLAVKTTKTGRTALVRIGPRACDVLAGWKRECAAKAVEAGHRLSPSGFVWAQGPDGRTPWWPDTISSRWIELRDAAGMKGLRFHDIRHASGSLLLSEGMGIGEVSRRQTHSPQMLASRYTRGDEAREDVAAGILDRALGG